MFKKYKNGISLRTIHIWLITTMIIWSGTVVISSFRLTNTFMRLSDAEKQQTELIQAAHQLMDASDYLTERVQRFAATGDIRFLNEYFTEAFESGRREEAISRMDINEQTKPALEELKAAMASSVSLMDQEYYAMRLVIEAKGYTDYPDVLDTVVLDERDMQLSADDKIRRATELVLNDTYYEQKDNIRRDMQESLGEIDKMMETIKNDELARLHRELTFVRIVIIIQATISSFSIYSLDLYL